MKYPMLANYLLFYKKNDDTYLVFDTLSEEYFEIPYEAYIFAKQLDGKTNPMDVAEKINCGYSHSDVKEILKYLDNMGCIRQSRFLFKQSDDWMYSVKILKHHSDFIGKLFYFLNAFLVISWLPVLIVGFCLLPFAYEKFSFENSSIIIFGFLFGFIIGCVFHEFSHAFACIGFGGNVFEFGIGANNYIPYLYTLIFYDNIKSRTKQNLISFAGIEMNLFLSGVFMILSSEIQELNVLFFAVSYANFITGILNLILIDGSDGMHILENLFDTYNLSEKADKTVHSKKTKRLLKNKGVAGKFTIVLYYFIYFSKILSKILAVITFISPVIVIVLLMIEK